MKIAKINPDFATATCEGCSGGDARRVSVADPAATKVVSIDNAAAENDCDTTTKDMTMFDAKMLSFDDAAAEDYCVSTTKFESITNDETTCSSADEASSDLESSWESDTATTEQRGVVPLTGEKRKRSKKQRRAEQSWSTVSAGLPQEGVSSSIYCPKFRLLNPDPYKALNEKGRPIFGKFSLPSNFPRQSATEQTSRLTRTNKKICSQRSRSRSGSTRSVSTAAARVPQPKKKMKKKNDKGCLACNGRHVAHTCGVRGSSGKTKKRNVCLACTKNRHVAHTCGVRGRGVRSLNNL
jgi:hypothetical protein